MGGAIGFLILGQIISLAAPDAGSETFIAGTVIGLVTVPLVWKTYQPDRKAIKYNNGLRMENDKLLKENKGIENYNNETRRLVVERQKQIYINTAIDIGETTPAILE